MYVHVHVRLIVHSEAWHLIVVFLNVLIYTVE